MPHKKDNGISRAVVHWLTLEEHLSVERLIKDFKAPTLTRTGGLSSMDQPHMDVHRSI